MKKNNTQVPHTQESTDLFSGISNSNATFEQSDELWLGLVIDNRQLFDALQDGWIYPASNNDGLVVGVNKYVPENIANDREHAISVALTLDPSKLANLGIQVQRKGTWRKSTLDDIGLSDSVLFWPGPLPTFAITELIVGTSEEAQRLIGIAQNTSNLELPACIAVEENRLTLGTPPSPKRPAKNKPFVIPPEVNPIHGAMNMAVWAIPRVAPWVDLLASVMSPDQKNLKERASAVDALWWCYPPWGPKSKIKWDSGAKKIKMDKSASPQEHLWLAATKVFLDLHKKDTGRVSSHELAERIAKGVTSGLTPQSKAFIKKWLQTTLLVLDAKESIHSCLKNWKDNPVGLAIQLVLLRPDPEKFQTWRKESASLPPAVWWSAAVLSGLFTGYSHLSRHFRGKSQQEYLVTNALQACQPQKGKKSWPGNKDVLSWSKRNGHLVLLCGDQKIKEMPESPRNLWLSTTLESAEENIMARNLAEKLEWSSCLSQELVLANRSIPFSGIGKAKIRKNVLDVQGEVALSLSPEDKLSTKIDVDVFRHHLITAPASSELLEPPPQDKRISLLGCPVIGLSYAPNFITEDEEQDLLAHIDNSEWHDEKMARRVQHYGWQYDYKKRQVNESMRTTPLPSWATRLAKRLKEYGLLEHVPDQLLVNEYTEAQGISKHVDSDTFADGIAMISLGESWEMMFRKGKQRYSLVLGQRSAAIITGAARYDWLHEIPKRKYEPATTLADGATLPKRKRVRRVSLTFRKVKSYAT